MARCLAASIVLLTFAAQANTVREHAALVLPEVPRTEPRLITIDDMAALRRVDALEVSPDGRRFAVFVRQGDPVANDFLAAWFVGDTQGGALTHVGEGGEVRLMVDPVGRTVGTIERREARWSPDGQWIAYTLRRDDEVHLWRGKADGSMQEQITHHPADVREFAWSEDGRALYFTVGAPRIELHAKADARARDGYRYDEDLYSFTDLMNPQLPLHSQVDPSIWVITLDDRQERAGAESERAAFQRAQARHAGGVEAVDGFVHDAAVSPSARADGALTWLERTAPTSRILRVVASLSRTGSDPITCKAEECSGVIHKVWWSDDGNRVLFWRREGIGHSANGFYAWSPASDSVQTILRLPDDFLDHCRQAAGDELICVRETPVQPVHVAAIDLKSGVVRVAAELNPEFRNIRLGKVERFEWDTPRFDWNEPGGKLEGLYPKRAYGYILYPPDFDSSRKYPVFIEPYVAHGFDNIGTLEHPLHVYAANGFVVLNTQFPMSTDVAAHLGGKAMQQLYSAELGFPHLSMYMESTLRALDVATARGFIDEHRVGIGGVSHGTFIPLYMMQKHDRIGAISISGGGWGPLEYYWATRKGAAAVAAASGDIGYEEWKVKPEGEGRKFWSQIDIADHIDTIEAPILMNLAAAEVYSVLRLVRHLADAGKAYDAYVFPEETHIKWQPAHLHAIMNRNLDWFRFWLQNHEDPAPAKADQYARWRKLREQHEATRR